MKTMCKNFTFYGGFNIGPYKYEVADLPIHGSYLEVFRSKEVKYPSVKLKFKLSNYGNAKGIGYLIKTIIWNILAEKVKYKESNTININAAYSIKVDDDLSYINFEFHNFSFSGALFLPSEEYPRDRVLQEMKKRKMMTFKELYEWCLDCIKRCVEYKITEEDIKAAIEHTESNYRESSSTVNLYHPIMSKFTFYGTDVSNYISKETLKSLTVEEVSDMIHNMLSVFAFKLAQFELPEHVTLYEIDDFTSRLITDVLNYSKKDSKYAKDILENLSDNCGVATQLEKSANDDSVDYGDGSEVVISNELKIATHNLNLEEFKKGKYLLARTKPVIIRDDAYLYYSNKFSGMFAYFGNMIAQVVLYDYMGMYIISIKVIQMMYIQLELKMIL